MEQPSDRKRVLTLVQGPRLPHPDGELLTCFLEHSSDHDRAARYLVSLCDLNGDEVGGLSVAASHWKRLVKIISQDSSRVVCLGERQVNPVVQRDSVCFLTGTEGSLRDPLVVAQIFPYTYGKIDKSLWGMLEAFLSLSQAEWLASYIDSEVTRAISESNLWVVRRSAAAAFSQGFFQVNIQGKSASINTTFIGWPRWPNIVLNAPDLRKREDVHSDATTVAPPDPMALDVHSCLAESIRWSSIAEDIWPKDTAQLHLAAGHDAKRFSWLTSMRTTIHNLLLSAWLLVPSFCRIAIYHHLAKIGRHLYGPSSSFKVQRLPFGMYLKTSPKAWHTSLSNELQTLTLLRDQIPALGPKPLDLVSGPEDWYLLTSRQPGVPAGHCIDRMSNEQLDLLAADLQGMLELMRTMKRDPAPLHIISNTSGGACYDGRIITAIEYDEEKGDFVGPFRTEKDFNQLLRSPHLPDAVHMDNHKIVFTHGDINPRNVLVNEETGRLSGIVDWETAGWYPDYWEYTKAHFSTKFKWRWKKGVIDAALQGLGDFERDLQIEKELWWYCF